MADEENRPRNPDPRPRPRRNATQVLAAHSAGIVTTSEAKRELLELLDVEIALPGDGEAEALVSVRFADQASGEASMYPVPMPTTTKGTNQPPPPAAPGATDVRTALTEPPPRDHADR